MLVGPTSPASASGGLEELTAFAVSGPGFDPGLARAARPGAPDT